jgi:cytochrome c biogenesis protein CcdA
MDDISALSYPVAFAAGFVSFASPCVLALVPGYLHQRRRGGGVRDDRLPGGHGRLEVITQQLSDVGFSGI